MFSNSSIKKVYLGLGAVYIFLGLLVRLWHINSNQFMFYDEGMWAAYAREFVSAVQHNPPHNIGESVKILGIMSDLALSTAKSFWAFLSMLRVVFVGENGFYFTRIISAVCGLFTVGLIYLFGRDVFKNRTIGLWAALILLLLPSHVFYSRLALQESLSALFFTLGLYCYLTAPRFSWKVLGASFCFVVVFLSNYRMIIIPFFLLMLELLSSFTLKQKINFRLWIWTTLVFLLGVFSIGHIGGGKNTNITFAWMFYQSQLAQTEEKSLVNILSYPYFLFRLESIVFGFLFFSGIYLLFKKRFKETWLFVFVLVFMLTFSFSQEKGARYMCSVLPLIAMVVAVNINVLKEYFTPRWSKIGVLVIVLLMTTSHAAKSLTLAIGHNAYEDSIHDILKRDPQAKIFSSQNQIQQLYLRKNKDTVEPPKPLDHFVTLYQAGFKYLILDPQAYISMTEDGHRFSSPLRGYLGFIKENISSLTAYEHLTSYSWERFVFEHNINLVQSIKFVDEAKKSGLNKLYIYDVGRCIIEMRKRYDKSRGI